MTDNNYKTSSKWRASAGGKGDRSRVTNKEAYDETITRVFGDRPCPIESRDLSWLSDEQSEADSSTLEEEQEGSTDVS